MRASEKLYTKQVIKYIHGFLKKLTSNVFLIVMEELLTIEFA